MYNFIPKNAVYPIKITTGNLYIHVVSTCYTTMLAHVKSQHKFKMFIKNRLCSIWDVFLICIIQFFADKNFHLHPKLCASFLQL